MGQQGAVQRLGEETRSAAGGNVPVCGVMLEELSLGLEGVLHWLAALNILLRSVDDADEAEFERVDTPRQDFKRISPMVH